MVEQQKRAEEQRKAVAAEALRLDGLRSDCKARGGVLEGETCKLPPPPPTTSYTASTQVSGNLYTPGQCTWYVASKRSVPGSWGNARSWLAGAQASGYATGSIPRAGAIAWSGAGYFGHVAIVEEVTADGVWISEMNGLAGPFNVDRRLALPGEFTYIY